MTNLKIMTIIITGRTKYLILVLNETKEILELKGNIFFFVGLCGAPWASMWCSLGLPGQLCGALLASLWLSGAV